jgi:aminoglycoside phosphotransferase (APT) family kinase protein
MARVHDDEIEIDEPLVRGLLVEQFPEWSQLPLARVEPEGTVNVSYRLGVDKSLRLPRIDWAAEEEHQREHLVLPLLAPQLPVRIPAPIAQGRPGPGYPWTWWVFDWIEGDLPTAAIDASELAGFVTALQRVTTPGAPDPSGNRDKPLAFRDSGVREALERVEARGALELWERAMRAPQWAAPGVWIHADLDRRNVLVRDGRLSAVLDWGGAGVGDPAIDVMAAWKLVAAKQRKRFRTLLAVDDDTWLRAQGWVVSQALIALAYYTPENNPAIHAEATRWLVEVLHS